jgi:hypothetical protein
MFPAAPAAAANTVAWKAELMLAANAARLARLIVVLLASAAGLPVLLEWPASMLTLAINDHVMLS